MSTVLKLGLSADKKTRFWAFECEHLLQISRFLWGKKFGSTRHLYKKMNPPSIVLFFFGGGALQVLLAHSLVANPTFSLNFLQYQLFEHVYKQFTDY